MANEQRERRQKNVRVDFNILTNTVHASLYRLIRLVTFSHFVGIYPIAEMSNGIITNNMAYPILFIPKKFTTLNTQCTLSNVCISSLDKQGNRTSIYKGTCNIRFIDSDVNIKSSDCTIVEQTITQPAALPYTDQLSPLYNESDNFLDPSEHSDLLKCFDDPSIQGLFGPEFDALIARELSNSDDAMVFEDSPKQFSIKCCESMILSEQATKVSTFQSTNTSNMEN